MEQLKAEGIDLVAPAMPPKGSKQGQLTLEEFGLDAIGRVVACPQGHAPVWTSMSETRLAVRFDPVACQGCPDKERCPGYSSPQAKKDSHWQYTHERVAQCHRRLAEQLPAFKDRYHWRAGIEATISRLKHQMHLAHLASPRHGGSPVYGDAARFGAQYLACSRLVVGVSARESVEEAMQTFRA